ncbi:hypothetical protein HYN56_07060 [Flavobacterium crocinum]|uniref:Lipocalin-like domain-containing protein n=1 Tax=Flavobacterium crocinum TaxID=2183896 RepID=A0A2S1YIY6_9FLAO|nr:hypothetical protein [Flavobacterium crocinum]AWK04002.1 hypothetical protein HYN56_07060 [Flavobacterium crocinum]
MKKKILLHLVIIILSSSIYSQNLLNEYWNISEIIGQDTINTGEFTLQRKDKTDQYYSRYGMKIIFNKDNSLACNYSAPCGNDCFPSSIGTYKMIDQKHINLFVKEFQQFGDCESKNIKLDLNLGNYYISKQSDKTIKLIKSNGDLSQDKLNEKYSGLIDNYIEEIGNGSSSLLNFKTRLRDNDQRIKEYIKMKMEIENYKILYTKKQDGIFLVSLIKNENIKDDYFYIINAFHNNYEYQVGYYKLKRKKRTNNED